MARRVSWTNNSSGHTGTYVYRATTLDPQALPTPVATVGPVAQGETAEWIDSEDLAAGDYDYAVQDYDGGGVGTLSGVAAYTIQADLSALSPGDPAPGGFYVGTITYADARQFHLIVADISAEVNLQWGRFDEVSGATDPDDGVANTATILSSGSAPAAQNCVDHVATDGLNDFYLGSTNEMEQVYLKLEKARTASAAFKSTGAQTLGKGTTYPRFFTSREFSSSNVYIQYMFTTGGNTSSGKASSWFSRPIRRVPV